MVLSREEVNEIRSILGREPTLEELAMFEAQWSEHCSYKSSRLLLKLLPTDAPHVIIGPGRDAPAVELFPGVVVVFKIESHNHPSAIDPYNGAATGIGGIIRDILTLGATPIALLDMLYMGDTSNSHAVWLIKNIVKGISDYGNRVGIPTVAGDTWFDYSFNKQPLVNVACIGVTSPDKLVRGRIEARDLIIIAGNTTGRDGMLGSSFASRPLAEDSDKDLPAVQVGNPLLEKLLIDSLRELVDRKLVKYIKDLGGGGLTTAISETAADNDLGVVVYLDKLHVREEGLTPLELLVSESQERMMLVTDKTRLEAVKNILEQYGVDYSVIGLFDDTGRIKVYYGEKIVADVPAKALARPRAIMRESRVPREVFMNNTSISSIPEPTDYENVILKLISSPNICSKKWIYEQYDYEVGVRTVIKPGEADAAVLRLLDGSLRGLAVKGDANPRYTLLDPFRGAANSVAENYRNLVAVGSIPIAIVDELNAGNPEKPEHYWYFEQMVKGVAWMTKELGIPVVGGKVSFYNEDEATGKQVKPTTTIVGVGRVDDVTKTRTMSFKEYGNLVLVLGATYPELGGTEYLYRIHGLERGEVPVPRPANELRIASFIHELIREDLVVSVHDISIGGILVAIIEMAIHGGMGFELDARKIPSYACRRLDELLFSETQARYVVEVRPDDYNDVLRKAVGKDIDVALIGKVPGSEHMRVVNGSSQVASLELRDVEDLYFNTLEKVLEET